MRFVFQIALLYLLCLAPLAAQRSSSAPSQKNPHDSPQDVAIGKKYFSIRCAFCHGMEGEGGRGVNLTAGQYRFGGSDAELFDTIRNGIPGSEMVGSRAPDLEVWRMVAFLKRLGLAGIEEKAAGNRAAGERIYRTKGGCAACHVINTRGGNLGPELTAVGLRRSLKYLQESLLDPAADIPIEYRGVTVVLAGGDPITGARLNEDDYSIQLRDLADELRSIPKAEAKQIRRDNPALMPAYGSLLSKKEIEDLVAYLSSLRGRQK